MRNSLLRLFSIALISTSGALSTQSFANDTNNKDVKENIEVTQQAVTKEEIAAIYVLSEICPSLIEKDAQFEQGYEKLLKEYLPKESNPSATIKSLVKQNSFKDVLKQAQQDAKNAGDQENKQVCDDIKNYQS